MSKIQIPRKLRAEDFKTDQQDMVSKLGDIYNTFVDEVYNTLNGRLDNTNLNRQYVDVDVLINSTGSLTSQPQIKTTVFGRVKAVYVGNAINLTNPGTYPTAAVGVSFTTNGNLLTLLSVTGLQANSQYKLTLELAV